MSTTVVASDSDTLCTLARTHGFLDCQPLRDEPANSDLLNRPLQQGDKVTIPDIRSRSESKSTDNKHVFRSKVAPPVSIRFVHGSKAIHYLDDVSLTVLNVSNFVTNRAGTDGRQPFPAEFEFHQAGDDDPDTFKVEVVDPLAGGSVSVLLEAIRPVYTKDPSTGALTAAPGAPFTGADHASRSNTLNCAKVHSGVAYRSRYLRLVTDERDGDAHPGDRQKVPNQTLLVTDMADGNGTGQPADGDTLEILDQQVRASYAVSRCPAPASNKCTVKVQLPIGADQRRKLSVRYHVYRTSVGGATVGGATDQAVRFRTFKWLRRALAQANIGPVIVGLETLDPPPANMLVISPDSGVMPTGQSTSGSGHSSLTFTLAPSPDAAAQSFTPVPIKVDLGAVVTNTGASGKPKDIGDAVVAALPSGFTGAAAENPPTFNATNGSCDVLIQRSDGTRVAIRGEGHDDQNTGFQIAVPRITGVVHPQAPGLGLVLRMVEDAPTSSVYAMTGDLRLFIRNNHGSDDEMNVYVVDFLENAAGAPTARGVTCLRGREVRSGFEAKVPIRNCIFLGRSPDDQSSALDAAHPAVDLTDFNFHTLPHETGHVLGDFGHPSRDQPPSAVQTFHNGTDLMGVGPNRSFNSFDACKRIPDTPVSVSMVALDPQQTNPGDFADRPFFVTDRMRTEGAGLLKGW